MDLFSKLPPDARDLVASHRDLLDHLPRTFQVSLATELRKWPVFFEPEKAYFRTLIEQIAALSAAQRDAIFSSLAAFEERTGCDRVKTGDPETLEGRLLDYLRVQGQYSEWRHEVAATFDKLEPMIEARLYGSMSEPRLVVMIYGGGIAIERDTLWRRFRQKGTRIPLKLGDADSSGPFIHELFTGCQPAASGAEEASVAPVSLSAASAPTLFEVLRESRNFSPFDTWIFEADDRLHRLCQRSDAGADAKNCAVGFSYSRLQAYRQTLSHAIYNEVQASGLTGPLQLAAYLKKLDIKPEEHATLYSDYLVRSFVRDLFLEGAGTLIINNTFVEWGAVQAIKRAHPKLVVTRFGVRDKMKPFSSLLLFSKPRATDQIPIMEDPLGSFVDVELLSYYIWLNAENVTPFRGKTLYLLLADGVDEMLAVIPGAGAAAKLPPATLPDVAATMAEWLRASLPRSTGRPIEQLLS